MKTMWLSFADPEIGSHLGIAVVDVPPEAEIQALVDFPEMANPIKGPLIIAAARIAHSLGINPGGEVLGFQVGAIPEAYKNRLLTKDEVREAGLA